LLTLLTLRIHYKILRHILKSYFCGVLTSKTATSYGRDYVHDYLIESDESFWLRAC